MIFHFEKVRKSQLYPVYLYENRNFCNFLITFFMKVVNFKQIESKKYLRYEFRLISGWFLGQKLCLDHEIFNIKCRTSSILEAFFLFWWKYMKWTKKSFDKPNSDIKRATWFLLLTIRKFRRRSKSVSTELVSISLIKGNLTTIFGYFTPLRRPHP